ncbi:hypothetical protein OAK45_03190 [Verrucomicrobia bacterium]|nr:hypothetical protein [Verrucomicrobiota bacterium]
MSKEQYLTQIRSATSYPQFRMGVTIMTVLAYIGCAVFAVMSVMSLKVSVPSGVIGLLGAALLAFIVIPFHRQALLMGADFVDSTLDKNSKNTSVM